VTFSIQIDPESGMGVVTCTQVLRFRDAKEAAEALWESSGWSGKAVVWDFRESRFDVSSTDIREVAEFILRFQPTPPPERVAWVTPRDVDFGLARMFEVFRDDAHTAFRVVRDFDEAVSWTRLLRPGAA